MASFKNFILSLSVVVVQLFVGCEMFTETPTGEAVVVLDVYDLKVDGNGGNIPVYYAVENPRPGARPEVIANVSWITVKSVANGTIMLYVAPSDIDEERFGFVTVKYEGMPKSVKITVLQDPQILDEFSFEVVDLTTTSCSIKYTPKQSNGVFMANIIDSDYFVQSGISDMNQFIVAEMENYLNLAKQHDITLQYLLEEAANPKPIFTKEVTRNFSGMKAGATYIAYAYGLELNGDEYRVTIPLHQISVTLPMLPMYDVTFNISAQIVNASSATIVVSPERWGGYYTVNIIPDSSIFYIPKGEMINEYTLRAMSNDFYRRARQAMQSGMSAAAFLNGSCYTGKQMLNVSVGGGSKYMVAVYAVESIDGDIPMMCSMPSISYL